MNVRIFLYKVDALGTHRLPGGFRFESGQPYRDAVKAVEALRGSLPPLVFADYEIGAN